MGSGNDYLPVNAVIIFTVGQVIGVTECNLILKPLIIIKCYMIFFPNDKSD